MDVGMRTGRQRALNGTKGGGVQLATWQRVSGEQKERGSESVRLSDIGLGGA